MSHRSTRNKLRWQTTKMMETLDKYLMHVRFIEDISEGASPIINETLPILANFTIELQKATERFRENL